MKKFFVLFICIAIVLNLIGCTPTETGSIPTKIDHKIFIIFPSARLLEQPDTLDVYNGNGVLLESFSTDGKCAHQIQYNNLEEEEVITIYSHTLDKTAKFWTIQSYIDDARGAGDWHPIETSDFTIMMDIDYETGEFKANWGGDVEYELWKDGEFNIKYKLLNSHLLKDKTFDISLASIYTEEGTNCIKYYIFDIEFEKLTTEIELFEGKNVAKYPNYKMRFYLLVNGVVLADNTYPVNVDSGFELTIDLADYITE